MTHLTIEYIRSQIANDPRFDFDIETDELGKAIVWLNDGYTWNRQDGDRTVESFIISAVNCDQAPRDTVAYWKERVANIENVKGGE